MNETIRIIFPKRLEGTYRDEVWKIIKAANMDFIPPLSARNSTCQKNLNSTGKEKTENPQAYFDAMENQDFILALCREHVVGFLSFIPDHLVQYPGKMAAEKADYITTIAVKKDYRNKGITRKMYQKLFDLSSGKKLITRTWSTNYSHLHLLDDLGFTLIGKIENDRGVDIDTVYFRKKC